MQPPAPLPRRSRPAAAAALAASGVLGTSFFLLPVPVAGRWTVPFDAVVQWILGGWPALIEGYALALVLAGAVGGLWARRWPEGPLAPLRTTAGPLVVRWLAVPLAVGLWADRAPAILAAPGVGGVIWGKLAGSIAVIVPLGAAALQILTGYGLFELLGAWMRPIMRPVFRLPGSGALDGLMSWVGSYSVGLYLTRVQLLSGRYTRREAFVVVTGFSTVSVGFVGVVASTLDLLSLFPWIVGTWFVASYALAALLARTWPATAIADTAVGEHAPEPEREAGEAWALALACSARAEGPAVLAARGLVDGLGLAAALLGTVLVVGTSAVLLAEHTPLFALLGAPLAPILALLGVPDAERVAPAVLAGITEVYVPALLVRDASLPARFFVATLSVSQLVFFSSVGPMMIDMFREVPVRAGHLVALFAMRTALLVPGLAAWTALLAALGVL